MRQKRHRPAFQLTAFSQSHVLTKFECQQVSDSCQTFEIHQQKNLEHFTSVGIPWETISFEVCPGTGYPKEPPWDRPAPIDCILVVNHGRGCIVVVNSDRTLSPLLPFLGTLTPIVCSGPTWDPRGLSGQWTGPKVSLLIWCYSNNHTHRQTGILIHPGKY